MKRDNEYKPLLFTTTLRNPERIKIFLSIIAKYDGQILTESIIDKIVFDIISKKEYIPMYVSRTSRLKALLSNDEPFSTNETKEIIKNSPQKHKEAGFSEGWASRFDTWYKFLKELGFVYYEMNKPIELSESGKNLVLANTQQGYEHLEQQVFLSAFAKYQRNNPFRRIKNKNRPLILLLQSIFELRNKLGEECAGISISEIPLFICWKDNNYVELVDKIINIRKKFGFTPTDEYIYSVCKDILELSESDEKRFKISNICHELPDEFIRKMRMTGLISLRGNGRFIDINKQEIEKARYIVNNYSQLKDFHNEREYFEYMKDMDLTLISLQKKSTVNEEESRKLFMKWVNEFEIDVIQKELITVSNNNMKSNHDILKFINEPLRLEFLTALALQKQFLNVVVKPNYVYDDEGMPTSFAPGNSPDIICFDISGRVVFEVTLMRGRQQVANEMIPIERHLLEIKESDADAFSVFIAPNIHPDALKYSEFAKFKSNVDIIPLEIKEFALNLPTVSSIRQYNQIKQM